jgi:transglutaminase-like putative cysteine protease
MWLNVEHTTRFGYDKPINEAYTEIRLRPAHDGGQRCSSFVLETEPRGVAVDEYEDRFGNAVHHFDVLEPHDELVVRMRAEVWTSSRYEGGAPPGLLDRHDFLAPTRYVPIDGTVSALGDQANGQADPLDVAWQLMRIVRDRMSYEKGSTTVRTRADEALASGRGVCQDFAHVLIGACRARGVPARYVSGYLFDPDANGDGTASHAWVDVHCGEAGWLSLDPTHDREQTEHYVRVAVGRDYADVPPTRGVYKGKATEKLDVDVVITSP